MDNLRRSMHGSIGYQIARAVAMMALIGLVLFIVGGGVQMIADALGL